MSAAEVKVQACSRSWLAQKQLHGPGSFTERGWHIPAANGLHLRMRRVRAAQHARKLADLRNLLLRPADVRKDVVDVHAPAAKAALILGVDDVVIA